MYIRIAARAIKVPTYIDGTGTVKQKPPPPPRQPRVRYAWSSSKLRSDVHVVRRQGAVQGKRPPR